MIASSWDLKFDDALFPAAFHSGGKLMGNINNSALCPYLLGRAWDYFFEISFNSWRLRSQSTMRTLLPHCARRAATFARAIDLPTPPLYE